MQVKLTRSSSIRLQDILQHSGVVDPTTFTRIASIRKKCLFDARPRPDEIKTVEFTPEELATVAVFANPDKYKLTFEHAEGLPELMTGLGLASRFGFPEVELVPDSPVASSNSFSPAGM